MEEKSGLWGKVGTVLSFVRKHALLFTLILVLALQFVPNNEGAFPWGGIWMRMQTKDLPIADRAAESSVENFLQQQATTIAKQQYPNLPEENRRKVVQDIKKKFKEENKEDLDKERKKLADSIRAHYSYEENGQTFGYMPDIDPYFYLRYARNIVKTGHWYDEVKNGIPWDNHMLAPVGTYADLNWHPHVLTLLYRIHSMFNKQVSLMESAAYFPIVFIFLSLIFAFFITRKVAGNLGGFFTVLMLAVMPAVIGRTPWGHADTDAYNVFFPVLAVWLLFMALSAHSWKKQLIWAGLAGVSVAVFANLWTGWWYLFDFILGAIAVAFLVEILINFKKLKEGLASLWQHSRVKKFVLIGISFFGMALIFGGATIGFRNFIQATFQAAIGFTSIKEAALPSLWPNVFTTVAELNPASFSQILGAVGGTLMFSIACLGILLLLVRRDENGKFDVTYSALLAIWFIGTIYASFKGLRFTLLLGPAFAVAFGTAAGLLYQRFAIFGEKQLHIKKIVTGVLLIIILGLIIVNPTKAGTHMVRNSYASVINDVPIMNDAWWNSLTKIKEDSSPDAIVNSWWDFGHHFKFVADRAVTFDGSTQNSPQAHWIGRVLQTDNEAEAIAILRMVDCGANNAYKFALNKTKDPLISVKLVKKIIMQNKSIAAETVKEAGISEEILRYTHCDPPEDYFITSSDMIGKAGVWAHFGLWSFERAETWQKWRHLSEDEAVPQMVERFELDEKEVTQMHRDANALGSEEEANRWISPWPGYITTSPSSCTKTGTSVNCGIVTLNLTDMSNEVRLRKGPAKSGKVIIYEEDGSKEVFSPEGNANLAIVIWPTGKGVQALVAYSEVADSMFTRLYFL